MISQGKFKVLSNRTMGPDYFKMKIYAPKIAQLARPGQFVHLRCSDNWHPLLRRPFSFHRLAGDGFEILYKVIGRGTKLLAKKRKNDIIDVLGPLGNGFISIRNTQYAIRNTILVAGGMGVAPLLGLAEQLVKRNTQYAIRNTLILIGAKSKNELVCVRDFVQLGLEVKISTDDGSLGYKGLVTDLLQEKLSAFSFQLSAIYACGPRAMLKQVARLSQKFRIVAYGSLEENMACGVGACLGCAVKTKQGYKRVCSDGPVFDLQEIIWK